MSGLALWRDRWLDTYRHQQVQFWSPHSIDECLWRLRRVTTKKLGSRYLANRFGGSGIPGPLLRGRVGDIRLGSNEIAVAGYPDRREFYAAQLTAGARESPQGGTMVTGTIGLRRSLLVIRVLYGVGWFTSLAVALSMLVTGHLTGLFMAGATHLGSVIWFVVFPVGEVLSPARYERSAAALPEVIAGLLDAEPALVTATAPELPLNP
jgi:hypothetical protein